MGLGHHYKVSGEIVFTLAWLWTCHHYHIVVKKPMWYYNSVHPSILGARNMSSCYSTALDWGNSSAQTTLTFPRDWGQGPASHSVFSCSSFITSACASLELAATGGASGMEGVTWCKKKHMMTQYGNYVRLVCSIYQWILFKFLLWLEPVLVFPYSIYP